MIRDGADSREICETILHSGKTAAGLGFKLPGVDPSFAFSPGYNPQAFRVTFPSLSFLVCELGVGRFLFVNLYLSMGAKVSSY